MKCSDIMTSDPVCCLPGDTVDSVAEVMKTADVGSLPVVADYATKRLIGIVTDRDLALMVVANARYIPGVTVEDVMTNRLIACRPDDDARLALEAMELNQVRRLPVVDGDDRVVGIISQADLATRLEEPVATAEVLAEISKPATASPQ